MSGFDGSPATALHWRIDSFVSFQCCGEIASAWSLMLQKSRPEQKRAKSHASAGGCAPSPWSIGRLRMNASAEKVVWTWRSPKRICFFARSARCAARAATAGGGSCAGVGVPGTSCRPRQPATSSDTTTIRAQRLMVSSSRGCAGQSYTRTPDRRNRRARKERTSKELAGRARPRGQLPPAHVLALTACTSAARVSQLAAELHGPRDALRLRSGEVGRRVDDRVPGRPVAANGEGARRVGGQVEQAACGSPRLLDPADGLVAEGAGVALAWAEEPVARALRDLPVGEASGGTAE